MGFETRKTVRSKTRLGVKCTIPEGSSQVFSLASGNTCEMRAVDISESGMGMISEIFFPRGLIVHLEIEGEAFGLEANMLIQARVCHSKNQGVRNYLCGTEFIDLSPRYKKAIGEFIAQYEQRRSPRIPISD